MNQIRGHFEKVSFPEFKRAFCKLGLDRSYTDRGLQDDYEKDMDTFLKECWNDIIIPKRATFDAAGYDFYAPFQFKVNKMCITYPTGIRFVTEEPGLFLMLVPRSGLAKQYGVSLAETVGIIDGDYHGAENEGHIMANLQSEVAIPIQKGERFAQGIIQKYFVTDNDSDDPKKKRTGGHGSTGK